jgi:hypothetical protein
MTTCVICDDSHRMTLGDRDMPCTHCPLPCRACKRASSAYCETTPCRCTCHAPTKTQVTQDEPRGEPSGRDPGGVNLETFAWTHLLELCDDLVEMPPEEAQELRREIWTSVDWKSDLARRRQALAYLVAAWQKRHPGGSP